MLKFRFLAFILVASGLFSCGNQPLEYSANRFDTAGLVYLDDLAYVDDSTYLDDAAYLGNSLQHKESAAQENGKALSASKTLLLENDWSVFFFLSPECPLCQKYAAEIRRLQASYAASNIGFFGIFPSKWYSQEKVAAFVIDYGFDFPILLDENYTFTKLLGAEVTPEVFLLDSTGEIKYRGAIDNWAYEIGRTRSAPTQFYLKNALADCLSGEPVASANTKAVGCLIE